MPKAAISRKNRLSIFCCPSPTHHLGLLRSPQDFGPPGEHVGVHPCPKMCWCYLFHTSFPNFFEMCFDKMRESWQWEAQLCRLALTPLGIGSDQPFLTILSDSIVTQKNSVLSTSHVYEWKIFNSCNKILKWGWRNFHIYKEAPLNLQDILKFLPWNLLPKFWMWSRILKYAFRIQALDSCWILLFEDWTFISKKWWWW